MLIGTPEVLEQRKLFDKMPGVSFGNLCFGFLPAFRNGATGETHIAVNDDGSIALAHNLDNLPLEWVKSWDEEGRACELLDTIYAGFMRGSEFFSLDEIRDSLQDD